MRWLVAVLILCGSMSGQTFVQCQSTQVTGPATAAVAPIATTLGNAVIVAVSQGTDNTGTVTITDSGGQSYTQTAAGYSDESNANSRSGLFFKANSAVLSSITSTWNGSKANVAIIACEFSGMVISGLEDTSVNSGSTTFVTSLTSGAFTTTNANDVLFYAVKVNAPSGNTFTVGSGYTIPANGVIPGAGNSAQGIQYKIVSSTQTSQTTGMTFVNNRAESVFGAFKGISIATSTRRPISF